MQILYKYADTSLEDKRFLIVNCDNVFGERDDVRPLYFFFHADFTLNISMKKNILNICKISDLTLL